LLSKPNSSVPLGFTLSLFSSVSSTYVVPSWKVTFTQSTAPPGLGFLPEATSFRSLVTSVCSSGSGFTVSLVLPSSSRFSIPQTPLMDSGDMTPWSTRLNHKAVPPQEQAAHKGIGLGHGMVSHQRTGMGPGKFPLQGLGPSPGVVVAQGIGSCPGRVSVLTTSSDSVAPGSNLTYPAGDPIHLGSGMVPRYFAPTGPDFIWAPIQLGSSMVPRYSALTGPDSNRVPIRLGSGMVPRYSALTGPNHIRLDSVVVPRVICSHGPSSNSGSCY